MEHHSYSDSSWPMLPQYVSMAEVELQAGDDYADHHMFSHQSATPISPEQQQYTVPHDHHSDEEMLLSGHDYGQDGVQLQDDPNTYVEEEEEDETEMTDGAGGDDANDSDYQVSEPEIFQDDENNYIEDYEYPEDEDSTDEDDSDKSRGTGSPENSDADEEDEEEIAMRRKKAASEIDSGEETESDIESLPSDQGEREAGEEIEIVDGVGSNAQVQACRKAERTFTRARENALSRLNAMIHRHEMDAQATVGVRERNVKGRDKYFDTADNGMIKSFTQLDDGLDMDEKGRKIPGDEIMEPYMFQNVKTLKTWKRPDTYTMKDVVAWSKSLRDPDDWYYSALKCYTTGEVEYMERETVLRNGKTCRVVVGYEEDGSLKGLRKRS